MNTTRYSVPEIKLASISVVEGVGGSVSYEEIRTVDTLIKRLSTLSAIIQGDGTINGKHKEAESLALVLNHQDKKKLAYEVFRAIIVDTPPDSILFLRSKRSTYTSEALSPVAGKLGYEGLLEFALLAILFKDKDLAVSLLLLIVENVPVQCFPINLQDTRLECLHHLKKLGIKTVNNGVAIDKAISVADSATY